MNQEELEQEIQRLEELLAELKNKRLEFGVCKINKCGLPCQGERCKEYVKK